MHGTNEMAGGTVYSRETKVIGYWATTAILAFAVLTGGAGQLAHTSGTLETAQLLGHPTYFLTILGLWKVLGATALLVPRFPRLKEWAYAGIFFELTGAAASHALSGDYGDYAYHLIVPLFFAALAVASWALRPQSRTLGVLFPAGTRGPVPATGVTLEMSPQTTGSRNL